MPPRLPRPAHGMVEQWQGSERIFGMTLPTRLFSVSFPDAVNAWAAGAYGALLHTADGGLSWQRQPLATQSDITGVDFPDAHHRWLVMDSPASSHTVALHTTGAGAVGPSSSASTST